MVSRSSARVRPNRRMSSSLIVWSQARYFRKKSSSVMCLFILLEQDTAEYLWFVVLVSRG